MFWLNPYNAFCLLCSLLINCGKKGKSLRLRQKFRLDKSVHLGEVRIVGRQLTVGNNTYMNSGHIATAPDAEVSIGKWCAIGHNVTILAYTHDTGISTGPEALRPSRKGNIVIEDGVWIGSNVIITPGVTIGRMSVIGGNSVVNRDVPPGTLCAGIPARVINRKEADVLAEHAKLINIDTL